MPLAHAHAQTRSDAWAHASSRRARAQAQAQAQARHKHARNRPFHVERSYRLGVVPEKEQHKGPEAMLGAGAERDHQEQLEGGAKRPREARA
eukprot:6112796-Pleurochrysis_carterae.AAC.2